MRSKGKGHRFDKYWRKNNDLYDIYWYVGRDIDSEINEVIEAVKKIEPYSDYEVKDKENLLDQLTMLRLRNELLQKEMKQESEIWKMKEIIKKCDMKRFSEFFDELDHYEQLEEVKDYLVEHRGYSQLEIGDNTDFEIKGREIVVDLEVIERKTKTYKVSKAISSRIGSTKDLNDFYAYVERFGEDYVYDFESVGDLMRIDRLVDDINYEQGVYDEENVKRILGV